MFQNIIDTIRLLFRKEKEPYLRLKKITGFYPHNLHYYQVALMHKSMHRASLEHEKQGSKQQPEKQARGHEHKSGRVNFDNERLEYLGDAVLGAVVADILYQRYPRKQEGFLTTLRSKLVRRDTLNKLAEQIGLDKFIRYDGRRSSAHNSYMNGNAFEAFIGAIYLDRGYQACKDFMQNTVFRKHINIETVSQTEENHKSKLIEWCQKYQLQVSFDIVSQKILSDRNTPKFVSRVTIEGIYCGQGDGYSKKESHQAAARQVMNKIRRDVAFVNNLMAAHNKNRAAQTETT